MLIASLQSFLPKWARRTLVPIANASYYIHLEVMPNADDGQDKLPSEDFTILEASHSGGNLVMEVSGWNSGPDFYSLTSRPWGQNIYPYELM